MSRDVANSIRKDGCRTCRPCSLFRRPLGEKEEDVFPINYALAAVLLTTPPADTSAPLENNSKLEHLSSVRPAVRDLALAWEIMDQREVRYVLTRSEDFTSDLKLLQRRYQDLGDAPPLYDCMRFPDRSLVNDMLAFNRAYQTYLEHQEQYYVADSVMAWEIHQTRIENQKLYEVWDLARDTRCDYYYVTVRRAALNKLKQLLGDQAYASGILPPHVPVWRFRRID